VFVVLDHARRRVIHFDVTANPTAQWTAQQITSLFGMNGILKRFFEIILTITTTIELIWESRRRHLLTARYLKGFQEQIHWWKIRK
jgi:hypothetical protein